MWISEISDISILQLVKSALKDFKRKNPKISDVFIKIDVFPHANTYIRMGETDNEFIYINKKMEEAEPIEIKKTRVVTVSERRNVANSTTNKSRNRNKHYTPKKVKMTTEKPYTPVDMNNIYDVLIEETEKEADDYEYEISIEEHEEEPIVKNESKMVRVINRNITKKPKKNQKSLKKHSKKMGLETKHHNIELKAELKDMLETNDVMYPEISRAIVSSPTLCSARKSIGVRRTLLYTHVILENETFYSKEMEIDKTYWFHEIVPITKKTKFDEIWDRGENITLKEVCDQCMLDIK